MLGVFERDFYSKSFLVAAVLMCFTLLATIVMLNMLIAIMADSCLHPEIQKLLHAVLARSSRRAL